MLKVFTIFFVLILSKSAADGLTEKFAEKDQMGSGLPRFKRALLCQRDTLGKRMDRRCIITLRTTTSTETETTTQTETETTTQTEPTTTQLQTSQTAKTEVVKSTTPAPSELSSNDSDINNRISDVLMKGMKEYNDPCESFSDFVCGNTPTNYRKLHETAKTYNGEMLSALVNLKPENKPQILQKVFQYIKAVYEACKDLDHEKCMFIKTNAGTVHGTTEFLMYGYSRLLMDHQNLTCEAKLSLREVVTLMKLDFAERVFDLSWLNAYEKEKVLNKLMAIIPRLVTIPMVCNDEALAEHYKNLPSLIGTETLQDMLYQLDQNFKEKKINNTLYETEELTQHLFLTNAYYNNTYNVIGLYSGILQEPMFYWDAPTFFRYGGIGQVLGHELSHGFDKNSFIDAEWLSDAAKNAFNFTSNCLIKQFSNYCFPIYESAIACLKGEQNIGEVMADLGGMRLAYEAFLMAEKLSDSDPSCHGIPGLQAYSKEQLFFITFATNFCENYTPEYMYIRSKLAHPPGQFRIDGTLVNFPPFAKAFNCASGRNMNPIKKCDEIWT